MASAKLLQVIETSELRGVGTEESPMRNVTQYFSVDGAFLAETDPFKPDTSKPEHGLEILRALEFGRQRGGWSQQAVIDEWMKQ